MYRLKWDNLRVHIWHDAARVHPEPSSIHTHPWRGQSMVLTGAVKDLTYLSTKVPWGENTHTAEELHCGAEGGLLGISHSIVLEPRAEKHYMPGDVYDLYHQLFHETQPISGTITLVQRYAGDHKALIALKVGEEFVPATPRGMSRAEIHHALSIALSQL